MRTQRLSGGLRGISAVLVALALCAPGCTSMRTLDVHGGQAAGEGLEPGDVVIARLLDGRSLEMTVLAWDGQRLVGIDRTDAQHSVVADDIAGLEVKRYSAGKTAILIGVGVALVGMAQASTAYGAFLGGG